MEKREREKERKKERGTTNKYERDETSGLQIDSNDASRWFLGSHHQFHGVLV